MTREQEKRIRQLERDLQSKSSVTFPKDPIGLVGDLFKFSPTEYQTRLLEDESKRIVVRWSRQAGKV